MDDRYDGFTYAIPFQATHGGALTPTSPGYFQSGEEDISKLWTWGNKFAKKQEETAQCPGLEHVEPWLQVHE